MAEVERTSSPSEEEHLLYQAQRTAYNACERIRLAQTQINNAIRALRAALVAMRGAPLSDRSHLDRVQALANELESAVSALRRDEAEAGRRYLAALAAWEAERARIHGRPGGS